MAGHGSHTCLPCHACHKSTYRKGRPHKVGEKGGEYRQEAGAQLGVWEGGEHAKREMSMNAATLSTAGRQKGTVQQRKV